MSTPQQQENLRSLATSLSLYPHKPFAKGMTPCEVDVREGEIVLHFYYKDQSSTAIHLLADGTWYSTSGQ